MKYKPSEIIPEDQLPKGATYRLANSFRNFLFMTWRELEYGAPTPIQYAMADWLQYGPDYRQLLAFRGAAKSYITTPFCMWLLYRDPDVQVLTTSATKDLADQNAFFAWSMLQRFDWLSHMRPTAEQSRSAVEFDVRGAKPAKGSSFVARGIFGQLTGLRADIIVGDDNETPNTSHTPGKRTDLRRRIDEYTAIRKPGGQTLFLGTAQCEETIYRDNESRGYATLIIPVLYPTAADIARYGAHRLAPFILKDLEANPHLVGTSTDPTRFPMEDVAVRRLQYGTREFDRQFRMFMDAGASGEDGLRLKDLMVLPLKPYQERGEPLSGVPADLTPPQITDLAIDLDLHNIDIDALSSDCRLWAPRDCLNWGKPDEVVIHIDPSGAGSDETAWCVSALKAGRVFILEMGADIDGYSDNVLNKIALCARKWGASSAYVEGVLGQGMFAPLLTPKLASIKHPCSVIAFGTGKAFKEKRIMSTLQPLTSAQRLVVNLDVFKWDFSHADTYLKIEEAKRRFYRFTYQYTRMAEVRQCLPKDDRLDVLAAACEHWASRVVETEKAASEREAQDRLQEEIDRINAVRKRQGQPLLMMQGTAGDIRDALKAGDKDRAKGSLWDRIKGKR